MRSVNIRLPRARTEALAVEEFLDETLVYDLKTNKAHSLNRTATLVWRRCDGETTVAEMARLLATELKVPAHEALVWMKLKRLSTLHLLTEQVRVPAASVPHTRREAMRALGLAAALPAIVSIVAPRAAHAQSCPTDCSAEPNCTVCRTGSNCNRKCCNGSCMNNGQAAGNLWLLVGHTSRFLDRRCQLRQPESVGQVVEIGHVDVERRVRCRVDLAVGTVL